MGLLAGFVPAGFSEWHREPARPLRMLTMVMNWDAFRPVGDPWCRLPGVECCFALRRTPDGALCCSSQPFHLFTALRCGLQTGPTPYIALANECTWAQALSAPKGLPKPCQQCTAPQCSVHGTHMPTVHLYVRFRALAGKVPVVCCRSRLHSTMSRYLLVVWQLYATVGAVEWSPGIAISAIATRHAADPAASS